MTLPRPVAPTQHMGQDCQASSQHPQSQPLPPPAHHACSPTQCFAAWRDCLIDSCPSAATSTEPAEERRFLLENHFAFQETSVRGKLWLEVMIRTRETQAG